MAQESSGRAPITAGSLGAQNPSIANDPGAQALKWKGPEREAAWDARGARKPAALVPKKVESYSVLAATSRSFSET